MRASRFSVLFLLGLAGVPGFVPAQASPLDHLKCYSVQDPLPEGRHWVTVQDTLGTERCEVKVPAVRFCTAASKSDVDPPDAGGGPSGTPAGEFLCYEVIRCDGEQPVSLKVQDQFGKRRITFHKSRLLCAPADRILCGRCLFLLTNPPQCTGTICTPGIGCMPNEVCDPIGCPAECPCCPVCGDGVCEGDETECNCVDDCSPSTRWCSGACYDNVSVCGDGNCEICSGDGESHENCPQDCPWPCEDCDG